VNHLKAIQRTGELCVNQSHDSTIYKLTSIKEGTYYDESAPLDSELPETLQHSAKIASAFPPSQYGRPVEDLEQAYAEDVVYDDDSDEEESLEIQP
jgi:hypothetical protein